MQCGICVATCPENVISLEPRYDFTPAALAPVVLKAEEPFHCKRCGKPFGTRSSVEKVMERLKGTPCSALRASSTSLGCATTAASSPWPSAQDPMALGPVRASARRTITSPPR